MSSFGVGESQQITLRSYPDAYPEAFLFYLWVIERAEAADIEAEYQAAYNLRRLADLILDHPAEFEALKSLQS